MTIFAGGDALLIVAIAAAVAILAGELLFRRAGEQSVLLYSGVGTLSGIFWVFAGVALLLGGFTLVGFGAIAIAVYMARGNYERFQQEGSVRELIPNRLQ